MRVFMLVCFLFVYNTNFAFDTLNTLDYMKRYKTFITKVQKIKKKTITYKVVKKDLEFKRLKQKLKINYNSTAVNFNNNGLKEFYDSFKRSVFMLGALYEENNGKYSCSFSSAFCISPNGICISSYSSFSNINERASCMALMDYDYNVLPITEILHVDKRANIVVFKIQSESKLYPLELEVNYEVADHIQIISHPRNIFFSVSEGVVSQKVTMSDDVVMVSAPFSEGSYGAPVVNDNGKVIAICSFNKPIYYNGSPDSAFQMFVNICSPIKNVLKLIEL